MGRGHPERPQSDARPAARSLWLSLVLLLGAMWGLVYWASRVPAPLGADAPEERFSEARARRIVHRLADELGPHPIGSEAIVSAASYLAGELRKIPGLEVEIQDAQGSNNLAIYSGLTFHYRVRNVLARLPGKRRTALLLNAHYDSPAESPGAGDNGRGASVAFETLRALAQGPALEQSVILLLNGGEEAGSVGAAGFLQHPWAKDVKVFIDLDGSPGGKALLMDVSAKYPALLQAYARAAPAPQTSVLFADVLTSGLTGASGDFEPLSKAGIPGLDLAGITDTWAAHTDLDLTSRLEPGATQHMGDTMLSVARELARGSMELTRSDGSVYFDLFARTALVYSSGTARVLSLLALALLIAALAMLVRAEAKITIGVLLRALGWLLLSAVAALLSSLVVAALLGYVLRRPHGWFSAPLLMAPTFIGGGLLGALAGGALWRRRSMARGLGAEEGALCAWAAALVLWGLLLLLCTVASVGAGYLPLLLVLPSSLALSIGIRRPAWRWRLWLLSVAIGALGFIEVAVYLLPGLAGLTGMSGGFGATMPPPLDFQMAGLLWLLIVFPLAPYALVVAHRAGEMKAALLLCGAVTLLGVTFTAARSPYDERRVKRVIATHTEHNGQSALLLSPMDDIPLTSALSAVPAAQRIPAGEIWPGSYIPGMPSPYGYRLPAGKLPDPPPRVEIVERTEAQGVRTIKLRIYTGGALQPSQRRLLSVVIPHQHLAGWSLGDSIPVPFPGESAIYALFSAPSTEGEDLTLRFRGQDPVEVAAYEVHAPGLTPALLDLRRRAPSWTNVMTHTMQETKIKL